MLCVGVFCRRFCRTSLAVTDLQVVSFTGSSIISLVIRVCNFIHFLMARDLVLASFRTTRRILALMRNSGNALPPQMRLV